MLGGLSDVGILGLIGSDSSSKDGQVLLAVELEWIFWSVI
jgi:hypothetical protein